MSAALRNRDEVRGWLTEHAYDPDPAGPDRVGIELEMFPYWLTRRGAPAERFALVELIALLESVPGATRRPDDDDGRPSWDLDGAIITEEPGAQLEVAGPPDPDLDTALRRIERIVDALARAFDDAGAGLATAGLDLWSDDEIPVQLEVPRYVAMSEYFRRRGDLAGFRLMSSTCSLQLNLDLGDRETAPKRWLLANLAAPVLTAAFAASPDDGAVNGRAARWREIDPTRTGVPPTLIAGDDDPLEHLLSDVLRADVMFVNRGGEVHAGAPGWRFVDWVDEGHPRYGLPTGGDLADHISTLWPEVRLRGYLELRMIDALPRRWRAAACALVVGLIYDGVACDAALETLAPHRRELPGLIYRAAVKGLSDPTIRVMVDEVLAIARSGAQRSGLSGAAGASELIETHLRDGRHLADGLREADRRGRRESFAWAEVRS